MNNKFEQIKQVLADAEADADKFFQKRNGAAGTRLRAALLTIKKLAQEARNEVTEIKNAGKE